MSQKRKRSDYTESSQCNAVITDDRNTKYRADLISEQIKQRHTLEIKNSTTCMLLISHHCKNAYVTLDESVAALQAYKELELLTNTGYTLTPSIELPVIKCPDPFLICLDPSFSTACSCSTRCVAYMAIGVSLPSMKSVDRNIEVPTCIICEYARISAISMLSKNSGLSVMKFAKFIEMSTDPNSEVCCLPSKLDGFQCIRIDGKLHHLVRKLSKNE